MIRLALTALAAFVLGRFTERALAWRDHDTYRQALARRLLDSDLEIHMQEVP